MTYTDEELFDHQVTVWTVGQLRAALAGLPEDLPVRVIPADEPGSDLAGADQVVISATPWADVDVGPTGSAGHICIQALPRRTYAPSSTPASCSPTTSRSVGVPVRPVLPGPAVSTMTEDNDGRFPDESEVLVRYPLGPGPERRPGQPEEEHLAILRAERETWPWLEGTVEQQCGPDEWLVTIEDRRLAQLEDGTRAGRHRGR